MTFSGIQFLLDLLVVSAFDLDGFPALLAHHLRDFVVRLGISAEPNMVWHGSGVACRHDRHLRNGFADIPQGGARHLEIRRAPRCVDVRLGVKTNERLCVYVPSINKRGYRDVVEEATHRDDKFNESAVVDGNYLHLSSADLASVIGMGGTLLEERVRDVSDGVVAVRDGINQ